MLSVVGSPPHSRDKLLDGILGIVQNRITPAYVGQIDKDDKILDLIRDHPRIRGTNSFFDLVIGNVPGSPPHTRDKYHTGSNSYYL